MIAPFARIYTDRGKSRINQRHTYQYCSIGFQPVSARTQRTEDAFETFEGVADDQIHGRSGVGLVQAGSLCYAEAAWSHPKRFLSSLSPRLAFFSVPDYKVGHAANEAFFLALRISPNQTSTERLMEMGRGETDPQGIVHSLEQGRLGLVIRSMVLWASVIALALAYLLIQFRGLSSLTGIDQAQVAREIARGNGFSTKNIRPLAFQQLQRSMGRIPAGNFPDTFNAPLNPLVNSLALRCFSDELRKKITGGNYVSAGDRLVAGVSILLARRCLVWPIG